MLAPSYPPSLRRWADGLAVGLIAQALAVRSDVGKGEVALRNKLRHALAELLSALTIESNANFSSLPLSTLRALTQENLQHELPAGIELVTRAKQTLAFLTTAQEGAKPPITAVTRLVAHLSLEGTCSSAFIMRCGKVLLSKKWNFALRQEEWKEGADNQLRRLRAQATLEPIGTLGRIDALALLNDTLPPRRPHWALIENVIFHQLYAWPLLVDPSDQPRYGCATLPVAVDLVFDGKSKPHVLLNEVGEHAPLRVKWDEELQEALYAAKCQWRSKHGGVPIEFRDRMMAASVSFDFTLAEQIVGRTPLGLDLFDRSMIPYFTQVILHRLLGRSLGFSCAVIGKLGDQRTEHGQPTLDFKFDAVGESSERKLVHVFESQGYAKAILSTDEPTTERQRAYEMAAGDGVFTEINFCHNLSNVADAVQPKGWRQHNYVRCPDVLRLLHLASHELLPGDHTEVVEIGKLLSQNDDGILHLPDNVSSLALVSYLHRVNSAERDALAPQTPPSLSWTFIRAVEGENDRNLWHTLWQTIGARWEDFLSFRHATDATAVASQLAAAMNTFSPSEVCLSHRAPDLLVVMGVEALNPYSWKQDAEEYRTHLFKPVMDALATYRLLPTPIEQMRRFIGNTRIIVMYPGDREVAGLIARSKRAVSPQHRAALERLSTFRIGFTQQMAKVLLGDLDGREVSVREILRALVDSGHLRFAAGEYWISGAIGTDAAALWPPTVQAQRHFAAAKAFAPYLAVTKRALQVDLNTAFSPQIVHEAMFHTEIARKLETARVGKLARRHPDRALHEAISIFKGRLLRFVQLPSPGTVEDLTRDHIGLSSTAAWELATEQLAEKLLLGIDPTPQELTIYASAGADWLDDVKNDPNVQDRDETRREVLALYDRALSDTRETKEANNRRLSVLTHYGHFLQRHGDREDGITNNLSAVREAISALIDGGFRSSAVQAKWFETEGDRCENPQDAARQYQHSATMSPKYWPCRIKLVGAELEPRALTEIESTLRSEGFFVNVLEWADRPFPIGSGINSDLVRARWTRAGTLLQSMAVGAGA